MKESVSIRALQEYIRAKDCHPEQKKDYFLKLAEEVGELARAMRKSSPPATIDTLKGSVEEELVDVLYYTLALANCYDIDLETWFPVKEQINRKKYGDTAAFPFDSSTKPSNG